jgi:hypothetical protein
VEVLFAAAVVPAGFLTIDVVPPAVRKAYVPAAVVPPARIITAVVPLALTTNVAAAVYPPLVVGSFVGVSVGMFVGNSVCGTKTHAW